MTLTPPRAIEHRSLPGWKVSYRRRTRRIVGRIGIAADLLMTMAILLGGYVWYMVDYSTLLTNQAQHQAQSALDSAWSSGEDPTGGTVTTGSVPLIDGATVHAREGQEIAKITIPHFGTDWGFVILQGVNQDTIVDGPGHYPTSQAPGGAGNFAIAGHRVGSGSPFDRLGELATCDPIIIETGQKILHYRVLPTTPGDDAEEQKFADCASQEPGGSAVKALRAKSPEYQKVPGRTIVSPDSFNVTWAIPAISETVPKNPLALLTITTCHPRYSDRERMVIHAVLTDIETKGATG